MLVMRLILFIIPTYLFVIGNLYLAFPPKREQKGFGFRTQLTTANDKIWHYSQKLYAKKIILGSIMMLPVVIIAFIIKINLGYFILFLFFEVIILAYIYISVLNSLIALKNEINE